MRCRSRDRIKEWGGGGNHGREGKYRCRYRGRGVGDIRPLRCPYGGGRRGKGHCFRETAVVRRGIQFLPGDVRGETVTYYDTSVGNVNARSKEGYTWSLFDDSIKQQILEKGIDRGVGMDNLPGTRPVNFYAELNAALERGTTEVFVDIAF